MSFRINIAAMLCAFLVINILIKNDLVIAGDDMYDLFNEEMKVITFYNKIYKGKIELRNNDKDDIYFIMHTKDDDVHEYIYIGSKSDFLNLINKSNPIWQEHIARNFNGLIGASLTNTDIEMGCYVIFDKNGNARVEDILSIKFQDESVRDNFVAMIDKLKNNNDHGNATTESSEAKFELESGIKQIDAEVNFGIWAGQNTANLTRFRYVKMTCLSDKAIITKITVNRGNRIYEPEIPTMHFPMTMEYGQSVYFIDRTFFFVWNKAYERFVNTVPPDQGNNHSDYYFFEWLRNQPEAKQMADRMGPSPREVLITLSDGRELKFDFAQ